MRLIALGEARLCEGFSLLGFETYPDSNAEAVEKLLCELLTSKQKALVFLAQPLELDAGAKCYQRVRNESGYVILVDIPPLNDPDAYRPSVEELISRVLGPAALEE